MYNPLLFVTLVALLVERLLELFDALVVLNFFPWWRQRPPSPPRMPLKRPPDDVRSAGEPGVFMGERSTAVRPVRKVEGGITCPVGGNELEISFEDRQDGLDYYTKEKEQHFRRLVYYAKKYGHFLSPRLSFIQWCRLEERLARREQIAQLPLGKKELARARQLLDTPHLGHLQNDNDLILLETLAEYCYLRGQRTFEAFALLKRQGYFVLGTVLGIALGELLRQIQFMDLTQLVPRNIDPGNAGYLHTAMRSWAGFVQPANNRWAYWGFGAGSGWVSQPVHYVTNLPRSFSPRPSYGAEPSATSTAFGEP